MQIEDLIDLSDDEKYHVAEKAFIGDGCEQDRGLSVRIFAILAEKGYSKAQCKLGYLYEHGEGIAKNHKAAALWYKQAANSGNAEAMFRLGNCYLCGYGVEMDRDTATYWFSRAAEFGYER